MSFRHRTKNRSVRLFQMRKAVRYYILIMFLCGHHADALQMRPLENNCREIQFFVKHERPGELLEETELDSTVALFDTGAQVCTVRLDWLWSALEKKGWTREEIGTLLSLGTTRVSKYNLPGRFMLRLGIKKQYTAIQNGKAVNGTPIPFVSELELRFCIEDKPCRNKRVFPIPTKTEVWEFKIAEGPMSHDVIFSNEAAEALSLREPSIAVFMPVPPQISKSRKAIPTRFEIAAD